MVIQWFPGHMAKTERLIRENSKLVDVVIELIDARIPAASRNPRLDELSGGLPKVVAMAKEDLADPSVTQAWMNILRSSSRCAAVNLKSGAGLANLRREVVKAGGGILEKIKSRGRLGRPLRAMVVGVPNVGKSTLINRLAGGAKAKVGNRPGVTRGKQWIVAGGFELLDTPGVLWPRFEDQVTGLKLALTGAIRDEVFDVERASFALLGFLIREYPDAIRARYSAIANDPSELIDEVGRKRGCLTAGGVVDREKAAMTVLTDFRTGKLGRISLEKPGEGDEAWILTNGGSG